MDGNCHAKSLARDDFHWFTIFESIDSYIQTIDGTGVIDLQSTGLKLQTGTSTYNDTHIRKDNGGIGGFSRSNKFKCAITLLGTTSSQDIAITI